MTKQGYLLLNLIFAGIILAIFVYSGIYSPEKNNHPVKCIHEELLGGKCPTCGMSRSFSAIVRGRIDDAVQYQQNSIPVFSFFLIQFILRLTVVVLLLKTRIQLKILTNVDITVSLLLFILTFRNLILQTIYIFYKMLLTGNIT
ncbi:MAG TPA: DUF2752 domain-containing protein [Bacteroidales bacterium]